MKTIPISDLRQRLPEVLEAVRLDDEPTIVLQRSRPAAYLVGAEHYERDQAELAALRRALFLSEVREAEAEYQAGGAKQFENVEQLLDELRG
jgi:prevent-host-death family protein